MARPDVRALGSACQEYLLGVEGGRAIIGFADSVGVKNRPVRGEREMSVGVLSSSIALTGAAELAKLEGL